MLQLAPDMHLVRIEDDIVILDLHRDSYLCWIAKDEPTEPDSLAAALVEAGFARGQPGDRLAKQESRRREWQDLPRVQPAVDFAALWRFAFAFCQSFWWAAGRPLGTVFKRFQSQHWPPDRVLADLAVAVATFDSMASWLPWSPECRFRSLLLRQFLRCDLDWIVGVRLYPFRAHCWLATDAIVVGDSAHRVIGYEPIYIFPGDRR